MSLRHGFYSTRPEINPDVRNMAAAANQPALAELVAAERFLHGDACSDPVLAHLTVKVIWQAGKSKYPSLWSLADRYIHSYEYTTMERLSALPANATPQP